MLRPIGRGAQSVVYLGMRDDDAFRQRVAIKLIRPEVDDPSIMRRFLAERQILAGLEHPNIARLYGGGDTGDGRPYLVMEHVEGLPITAYCDRHRLEVRSRLRLFLDVCEAVQYAHQSLLVHRDLKPGNILVTTDGKVKLLDFGIAKPLAPLDGLDPRTTHTGQRPMTPSYASPEQIRGGRITMATDVYSLGVLLHELLTGTRPYRVSSDLPHELALAICEEEARPPSTSFASSDTRTTVGSRARRRASSRAELRRQLRGDLDTIVSRALQKEPERRYASALHLAEDIRRHLDYRPIHAKQDHLGYRLGKLYRRHRNVAAAAAIALVLVGAMGLVVRWQAGLLESSRLDTARVAEVFVERLAAVEADPESVRPVPREALDASLTEIVPRLGADRLGLADMLETMGWVYRRAGLAEDARWLFEEALEQRRIAGSGNASLATAAHALGTVLVEAGALPEGERELRRSVALHRESEAGASYALAEALEALGRHRWMMGDLEEAEALLRESLEIRLEVCDEAVWTAGGMSTLAWLYLEQQRLVEAEPLLAAATRLRKNLSPQHRAQPRSLEDRGVVAYVRGDLEGAEAHFRRALDVRKERFGSYQPEVMTDLDWLARILIARGHSAAAIDQLQEALDVADHLALGSGPASTALLKRLGQALDGAGEREAAVHLLREVIDREAAWFAPDHPSLAVSRLWLGRALQARGSLDEAGALYRRAANVLDEVPQWDFGVGIEPRVALAALDRERARIARAGYELERALGEVPSFPSAAIWRSADAPHPQPEATEE